MNRVHRPEVPCSLKFGPTLLAMAAFILVLALQFDFANGPARVTAAKAPPGAVLSLHLEGQQIPVFANVLKTEAGDLVLTPIFPLAAGESYEARLAVDGKIIERALHRAPLSQAPPPTLIRILPDREVEVPANLLKFHLEFDQPMREGIEIFDHLQLADAASGTPVVSPWRRQEIWSPDRQRFTLLIHPGRIKQGVNLREEMGPALLPGREYRLEIGSEIRSLAGKALGKTVTHLFRTGPELRRRIDLADWELRLPESPHAPLRLLTDRPLDPFIAARHLSVARNGEPALSISIQAAKNLSEFLIIPAQPWQPGRYRLAADEFMEDLAGNTPQRAFDTDLSVADDRPSVAGIDYCLEF